MIPEDDLQEHERLLACGRHLELAAIELRNAVAAALEHECYWVVRDVAGVMVRVEEVASMLGYGLSRKEGSGDAPTE